MVIKTTPNPVTRRTRRNCPSRCGSCRCRRSSRWQLPAALGGGFAKQSAHHKFWKSITAVSLAFFAGVLIGQTVEHFTAHGGPTETVVSAKVKELEKASGEPNISPQMGASVAAKTVQPEEVIGVFFSIYYAMTGVHAIHILAGMGVLAWLLWRAIRGDFGDGYFDPVDYVGLYWHLVDLVWIYLFPLLYLIR